MSLSMIKIGAHGEHLPSDASDHVAVLLPDHRLMFTARVINSKEQSQTELEVACASVTCAGYSDWTMPEIDQLQLIVDRSRHSPALDPAFFLDIPLDWLWSKTPAAWSSASAWFVYAYGGYVDDYNRHGSGFALAVRRAGQ